MENSTVVDEQGRVYLPKKIREKTGAEAGAILEIEAEKKRIVLKPREGIARKSKGAFKLKRSVKDIDELIKRYSHEKAMERI